MAFSQGHPQAAAPPQKAAPPPQMFAVAFPGRPLQMNFRQVSPKNLVLDVPKPALISEFSVSLLVPKIPPDYGIGVFFALPPFKEFQYVGQVTLKVPTQFFRAPWHGKIAPGTAGLQLGLSVEPLKSLNQQTGSDEKEEEFETNSAAGIAKDLFNYMSSYTQTTGQFRQSGEVMVVPTNCIDKWYEKFKHKHKVNPFFWMKKKVDPKNPFGK